MSSKLYKMLEVFKLSLKSDAVPRAPRNTEETVIREAHNENVDLPEEQEEEIIIESVSDDEIKKEKKHKKKKSHKKSKKQDDDDDDEEEFSKSSQEKRGSASSVNVQAANVYNIKNSTGVRLGNDYYFGPVTKMPEKPGREKQYEEAEIEKDNFIRLLMEATIKPDRDYMDYISKNLGKNWNTVFRAFGFTQGRIETAEINAKGAGYDITEARYKLLLEWVNNDDDGTLGRLATLLWEEGERSIVKDLSVMYKKSKK